MSSVNVCLVNGLSGETHAVSVPRDLTVAGLQGLSSVRSVAFAVDGCTPSRAATFGDLYDACEKDGVLQVTLSTEDIFGGFCCIPSKEEMVQDAIDKALNDYLNSLGRQ